MGWSEALYTLILILFAMVVVITGGGFLAFYKITMAQMSTLEKAYSEANPQIQDAIKMVHTTSELLETLAKRFAPNSPVTDALDKAEDALEELTDGVPLGDKVSKSIDEIAVNPDKLAKNTLETDPATEKKEGPDGPVYG